MLARVMSPGTPVKQYWPLVPLLNEALQSHRALPARMIVHVDQSPLQLLWDTCPDTTVTIQVDCQWENTVQEPAEQELG